MNNLLIFGLVIVSAICVIGGLLVISGLIAFFTKGN